MKGEELKHAIAGYIDKMPPLPTSVGKILEICHSYTASPQDLNKVISLDPVLLAKVMKLINSAYYGINQEVTSLVRAIIMLGVNTIKNLAVTTAVLATMGDRKQSAGILNLEGFWLHSLCVATTSKFLAKVRKVDQKDQETYFICGLLHDLGKIPLNNRLGNEFLEALQEGDRRRVPLYQAEEAALGYSHLEAGAQIITSWQLGEEILDTVAFHHNPLEYTGAYKDILYTVVVANYFANINEIGFSGNRFPEKPAPAVFDHLHLTWSQIEALEDQVLQEIEKAKIFLKISS